ncbi:hypothetical protein [Metallosphaera sp.]|uniref:hypothetical protein n=1 Tax=Metallosphaera sp. TaxID=2020860 RepID=UPI0031740F35
MEKMEMEKGKMVTIVFRKFQGAEYSIIGKGIESRYGKIENSREQIDIPILGMDKLIDITIDGLDFIVNMSGSFAFRSGEREIYVWIRD